MGDQGRLSTPQVARSRTDITNLVVALVFQFPTIPHDSCRMNYSFNPREQCSTILSEIEMEKLVMYIAHFEIHHIKNINGYDSSFYLANL